MITREEILIHKNQGKKAEDETPMILLKWTNPEGVTVMKTKTKIGPVDEVVGEVPRDTCYSRLVTWRLMLKAYEDGTPRRIRLHKLGDKIVQADLWISERDSPEWDSLPINWPGTGWVPFYLLFRG